MLWVAGGAHAAACTTRICNHALPTVRGSSQPLQICPHACHADVQSTTCRTYSAVRPRQPACGGWRAGPRCCTSYPGLARPTPRWAWLWVGVGTAGWLGGLLPACGVCPAWHCWLLLPGKLMRCPLLRCVGSAGPAPGATHLHPATAVHLPPREPAGWHAPGGRSWAGRTAPAAVHPTLQAAFLMPSPSFLCYTGQCLRGGRWAAHRGGLNPLRLTASRGP